MAKILFAQTAEGVKFYPVTITDAVVHIKGNTQKKLSEILDEIDYSGKADKVSSATSGNFAGLDANGNLTDSGKKAADFATAAQGSKADSAVQGVKINGAAVTLDSSKVADLGSNYVQDASYVHTDSNFTAAEKTKLGGIAAGAQVNVIESIKVGGTPLSITSKSVDIAVATGDAQGQVKIGGKNATVNGLGTAAYEDASAFDEAGAAAAVLGSASDTASDNTVYGAKKYADSLVVGGVIYKGTVASSANLPTTDYKKGWQYAVTAAGTYAGKTAQAGDFLIANKDYASGATAANDWDLLQGNVAVSNDNKNLTIGTEVVVATVEGVQIKVKQVEDLTKIEAVAVADTTEYADVTSLFTA